MKEAKEKPHLWSSSIERNKFRKSVSILKFFSTEFSLIVRRTCEKWGYFARRAENWSQSKIQCHSESSTKVSECNTQKRQDLLQKESFRKSPRDFCQNCLQFCFRKGPLTREQQCLNPLLKRYRFARIITIFKIFRI